MFKQAFGVSVVFGGMVVLAQTAQITMAQTPAQVNAKQITVRIDGTKTGTGVIIKRQGNTYIVLTNWHVVNTTGKYTIQTPDGQRYQVDYKLVRRIEGADLAELQFTSNQNYQIAEYVTNQVTEGTPVYVAGWADPDAVSAERSYIFVGGNISRLVSKPKDGYALVLTNITKPGMSGGPILDQQGRLVGINGQARFDPRIGATDYLGIAINTYKTLASAASVNSQRPVSPVVATQSPKPASENPQSSADKVTNERKGLQLAQEAASLGQFQQYDAALQKAQMAAQLAPNNDKIWFLLGGLYLQKKQYNEAAAALKKAESINPRNADVQFALGSTYFQQKQYQLAAQYYQAGLKLKPNDPEGLFDLGNAYYVQGKFQDANLFYQRSITQNPKFWPAITNIGLIKYEQGDVEGAIKQWQSATNFDNKAAEPALALAVALYTIGLKQQGLALGKQALLIDNRYRNLSFLQQNLWGKRLLADTKKFLEKL